MSSYSASASPSNVQTVYTYAGPQFAQPSGAAAPLPPREAPPPMSQEPQATSKHPVYMGQPRAPINQGNMLDLEEKLDICCFFFNNNSN